MGLLFSATLFKSNLINLIKYIFIIGPPGEKNDVGPDTDFAAVDAGYVSITPLHVDSTAYKALELLKDWLNKAEVEKTC